MLETNWKINPPRDGIEAGEQQSDDVRRNLFRALSQLRYSSKLPLTSQPSEAVELKAARAISRRVSCEKITRVVMTRTAMQVLRNCKHEEFTPHLSLLCLHSAAERSCLMWKISLLWHVRAAETAQCFNRSLTAPSLRERRVRVKLHSYQSSVGTISLVVWGKLFCPLWCHY